MEGQNLTPATPKPLNLSWIEAFFVAVVNLCVLVAASLQKFPLLVAFHREACYSLTLFLFYINDVADIFSDLSVSLSLFVDLKLYKLIPVTKLMHYTMIYIQQ